MLLLEQVRLAIQHPGLYKGKVGGGGGGGRREFDKMKSGNLGKSKQQH